MMDGDRRYGPVPGTAPRLRDGNTAPSRDELLADAERALTALTDQCAGSCSWGVGSCSCNDKLFPAVERVRALREEEEEEATTACRFCDGSLEGVSVDQRVVNSLANYCDCGRRRIVHMGGGYVLVHRDGCGGVRCGCWRPASGVGAGAAIMTPWGTRKDGDASGTPPDGVG